MRCALVGTLWRRGTDHLFIFLSDCILIKIKVDQSGERTSGNYRVFTFQFSRLRGVQF